jgi:type I restriction enzyme M protein
VALNCGHDRRGRKHKNNDFECISREWWEGKKGDFWNRCQITNPYYLVPRYYDKTIEKLLTQEAAPLHGKLISFSEMLDKGWITIRKGHEVGADAYGTGDIPFVRTSDIANFEISIDPTKSISQEVYEKYAVEQNLKSGDILMVVDGRYRIGRCAILNEFNYQCVVQSHLRIISVSSETPIEPIELLYLLNLPSVQREIRSLVFIQSTLGALGKRIKEIKLPLPAKNDQWRATLSRFSQVIYERAKLLQMLKAFDSYEFEF